MDNLKEELVKMLNTALELEHAARIQYLTHAELIKGLNIEKIIERLKEIASDECKHEGILRNLIANYLGGEPSMDTAETNWANNTKKILEINLKNEKYAVDIYKQIYTEIREHREDLKYEFSMLEHEIRHIMIDEEEHIAELSHFIG